LALNVLTYESFSPHVNSTFALGLGAVTLDLTLTEATRRTAYPHPGVMREPFSLIFRSTIQDVLPQQIYPFSHPAMGELEMFIVPIGRDADGVTYEAVFG
jgi:hypothetical protein